MRKSLHAVMLAVVFAILLSSCGKSGEHIEDYDFVDKKEIPISDVNIAYVYDGTMYLENDLIKLKNDMFLSENQFRSFDISELETPEIVFNNALSVGSNLIILDKNLSDNFVEYGIKKYPDVKFLSYSDVQTLTYDNLVTFSDDYLPYSYILGVITAKTDATGKIGIFASGNSDAKQFAAINSFAQGVKAVNQNLTLVVSDNIKMLSDEKCSSIYIPYQTNNGQSDYNTIGFNDNCKHYLKANRAYFFESIIKNTANGTFESGNVKIGINYGLCKDGLSEFILDDDFKMQIDSICSIFESGTPVFSENSIILSGNGIASISEKITDNNGNVVIDTAGNYFVYDDGELVKCNSYNELINEKMNYYLDNIEIAD